VALKKNSGEVVAVGKEAKDMLGRTPGNVPAVKPMNDGVIADFKVTEKMLTYLILKAHNQRALRPRIVIGVPVRLRRWRSVPSRTRRIGRGSATTFWLQEGRSLGGTTEHEATAVAPNAKKSHLGVPGLTLPLRSVEI